MEPGDKTISVLDAQTPKRLKLMPDGTYAEVVAVQFTMDATEHAAEHDALGVNAGFSKLGAAIRAYQAGYRTRPPVIFGIGDSNFTGEGAGTSGAAMLGGAFANSPMQQTATLLGSLRGLPVKKTAVFGEGNSGNNSIAVSAYDPRLTLGTNWSRFASANTIGGRLLQSTDNSDYLTINFGEAVSNIELYYPTILSGDGPASSVGVYSSNNTLLGTFTNLAGSYSIGALKIAASLPDGIVKIKGITAGIVYVAGVIAYPTNSIIIAQGTWSGSKVSDYASTALPMYGVGFLDLIQPDLTVIALTINDIIAGTSASAYNTSLSAIVAKAALTGDVILMTGAPGASANFTANNTWLTLEQEMQKVAQVYGCETISMHKEFASSAAIVAAGMSYNTTPHLNAAGYAKTAQILASRIRSLV